MVDVQWLPVELERQEGVGVGHVHVAHVCLPIAGGAWSETTVAEAPAGRGTGRGEHITERHAAPPPDALHPSTQAITRSASRHVIARNPSSESESGVVTFPSTISRHDELVAASTTPAELAVLFTGRP